MEVMTKEKAVEALKTAPLIGSVWMHWRTAHLYTIVGHSVLEDSLEPAVTYLSHEDGVRWTRKLSVFRQMIAGIDGKEVPRFAPALTAPTQLVLCAECLGSGCDLCGMRGALVARVP
jgi:hypothetical protein